jgi:hypothetical protein
MRSLMRAALMAALIAPLAVAPLDAQTYRFDLGVHGGAAWWSNMVNTNDFVDATENARFRAGWLSGAQATFWATPRVGVRANFGYTDRPLERTGGSPLPGAPDVIHGNINLWSGSGDLLFRFGQPIGPEFMGTEMLPYLALGLGAKWINPAGDHWFIGTPTEGTSGVPWTTAGGNTFFLEETSTLMGLVALGTDVRMAPNFALRLELGDRMFRAPIREVIGTPPGGTLFTETGQGHVGRLTHEVYGQIGLHMLMGLAAPPPPVVVAPPPPPPPAAPPAPPPPAEEAIRVCVIDPTAPGGVRMVDAVFVPARGDTLVTVDGQRVPLRTTVGTVPVAGTAEWFVQGQPLVLNVRGTRNEFVTFGTSRVIEPADLAFVGTVRGVPVYAAATQVQAVRQQLADAAVAGRDLEVVLGERAELRTAFRGVDVLYVPLQPVGCVFQPLQRVEEVRKVRG